MKQVFLAFCGANCSITSLMSFEYANSFSIDNNAKEFNLLSPIVDLKYVLINFNFEKLLSPLTIVTGSVNKSLKSTQVLGDASFYYCLE